MPKFSSEDKGTWFWFDEDNQDAGGICLRELTTDEHQRIERMTVKHRKKFSHGTAYDDAEIDEKLAAKMRWDFTIVDWKVIELDNAILDCTRENKAKMMNVVNFVKFFVESMNTLVESNKPIEEARLKNSVSSSSGNAESQVVTTA